jgi:eukaryotic-like serine/threonine-protein kinase
MVMLRISGMAELEQIMGRHKGDYAAEQIKRTLDDIAYKRGAEWSWEPGFGAKAVVGLLANSSRAAADAAWLAVDVHDALAAASEDIDVAIQASVAIVRGIASGERDRDGRLVRHALMPPAEYLAELLGQRAQLGSTWVAGGLYRMVRRDFLWGDAPTIDIEPQPGRVLPRVMRVYALERPLSREERVAEMALAPSDLVGRDAEKADLHAAYHRAVAPDGGPGAISGSSGQHGPASGGPSGAIVARAVVGEMGIGKTALVATFQGELPPDTRIIRIEASPVRIELPFGAMGDLVRDALSLEPDQPAEAVAAALEALLGPLAKGPQGEVAVGRLTELVTGQLLAVSDEEDLNYRRKLISTGIRRLLAALASRQPLVIVCDGLQWVDKQSLELISELVRRSDPLPILALMVTRPEERILPYLEGIVRIDLRGLSHDDQLRLVENRLGVREGVAGVCADLIPRVAGNPFFLLEMIDALLERGALELQQNERGEAVLARVEQERDGHGPPLPSTLEQIIGDRLRELPPHEHAVVDWLAVANGPLSLGDLAALGGSDGRAAPGEAGGSDPASDAREAVMRLCARGVCDQRGDAVDFRHTIARDVAYMAIDTPTRRRMHRRLGEHLASTPTAKGLSAAIVARHLSKGEAHEQAAELYLTAGHAARAGYQTQLATRYYQRALHLLPPGDPRRLLGHEALEAIYRVLGRRRERKAHLAALRQLSRELKHPRWVALALARSARLDLDEGHLTHGLPMAQRAAEVARAARAPSVEVEHHLGAAPRSRRHPGRARCLRRRPARGRRPPRGPRAHPRRGAQGQRSYPETARAGIRGRRCLRRGHRRVPAVRRAPAGGPRQERPRDGHARLGALGGRHRPRPGVDQHRSGDRRQVPDRQDPHQHRPGLRPHRRRAQGPRLPAPRPRGPRALQRSGLARRHPARLGRGHVAQRRSRRRPHVLHRRWRPHGRDGQQVRRRARAHRARAPRAGAERPRPGARPRVRGPAAVRELRLRLVSPLRHRHRGRLARRGRRDPHRGAAGLHRHGDRRQRPHRVRRRGEGPGLHGPRAGTLATGARRDHPGRRAPAFRR